MQRTEFAASLIPQQNSQNLDDTPVGSDSGSKVDCNGTNAGHSTPQADAEYPAHKSGGPYIDVIRRPAPLLVANGGKPEPSPTSSPGGRRLAHSPTYAPRYEAGVVRCLSKSLAPPPPGGPPRAASPPASFGGLTVSGSPANLAGASPYAGSPGTGAGGASFSLYTVSMGSPQATPGSEPTSPSCMTPSARSMTRGESTPGGTLGASPQRRRAGTGQLGNRTSSSRIDPEQVPRPVGQAEAAKEDGGKRYETNKYHVPPAATAVATILDRGSCSCEFIRATVNQVPAYPSTANTAHVPVAVICQPFAELTPHEEPVPLVDFGEQGPLRCTRCKAYVNPHFTWLNSGREATCNMCGHRIEVPQDYYCAIDDRGRRKDFNDRPELMRGTVDYAAPRDYSDTLPGVPVTAFVIEASQRSVQSGLLPQVIWTLRGLLDFMEQPASRIAIITFDHALHFHAFYPNLDGARFITVSETEDPFVPASHTVLAVDALDPLYRGQVEALLRDLPDLYEDAASDQVAGGAALRAAVDLVSACGGGHVVMFHASLQNAGVGALRFRDDLRLSDKQDSNSLFLPQQAPFFEAVATDAVQRGVAVSVFCAPPVGIYIDMASLTVVPRRTGGEVCYMPGYDPAVDGERLHYELSRTVVQGAVYSCVFKLRCSKGLAVEAMYATWDPEVIDQSTFHISRMSVDATCDFLLSHSERIEGQKHVYMQVACLHTDRRGRRLIRVHTLQLPVTSSLSNVFRYTEIDAVTNLLIKQAASSAISGNGNFKEKLSKACVDMLHAYRVNCASMTSAGQLILPESLKLLPLYVGAIRKMPAFRSGSDIRADDRLAALLRVLGLPIALTAPLIYPRIYTMLPLPERAGTRTEVGDNVHMPPTIACSSDKLALDRIYLVDTGQTLRLYIREEVSPEQLRRAFGVSSPLEVAEVLQRPEEELGEEAVRILAVVWQIRRERTRLPWQPFSVVATGTPEEPKLLATICEDRVAGEMNYVDFLCHIHKLVQNKQD